jgi:hypothetical protein
MIKEGAAAFNLINHVNIIPIIPQDKMRHERLSQELVVCHSPIGRPLTGMIYRRLVSSKGLTAVSVIKEGAAAFNLINHVNIIPIIPQDKMRHERLRE